ncbi:hypothetical protein ACFQ1R_11200 [Mariniflexile jejuense]|uniref:Uncharacterized protein n=1 Tax=Mariniflexile jejuense TaxID=1173582 RepID=A0ABW3JM91_9FLAO
MLKFKGLILTIAISFISLLLFETNGKAVALNKPSNTHHDIKIERSFNTLAITTANSFEELINFNKHKNQTTETVFGAKKIVTNAVCENDLHYLKTCAHLDLNLNTRTIIYPFHSFL